MRGFFAAMVAAGLSTVGVAHAGIFEDRLVVKAGVLSLIPDESADISTIGGDVDISTETVPAAQIAYYVTPNVSVELICCLAQPSVQAVGTAAGTVDLGEVMVFPPTVTVAYHFTNFGAFQPYVGAGVNYTHFFDEELPSGGVATNIDYEDSVGLALQAGVDVSLGERWLLYADVKKIWINSDVTIHAGETQIDADVDINPWAVSVGLGYRF